MELTVVDPERENNILNRMAEETEAEHEPEP